ncbi:hypothetical protein BDP27DRAFT_1369317 [Rhodocollybia butyracea]|uniref:Uncharacterized protein n=1 Tax=Rhodocollybia butyracea TaxID=206335 RepID=A0A9P5TZS5_9AGAR|nr:hypothetical protein BDP27DRAFT_1369317 [Rhodocollybia butyracea]
MPMPGPGGNSQVIAGGPSGVKPLVTLIDRKGSAKTGITETSDSATITKLLEEAFGVDSLSVDYQAWRPKASSERLWNSERGKPAIKPGQNAKLTQAMQSEWLNILNEFNARFMDPNFPVNSDITGFEVIKVPEKGWPTLGDMHYQKGELIEEGPPVVSTQKIAITAFINRVYSADPDWLPSWKLRQPEYQGQCVPDSQTQTSSWNDREWIYFTLTNYRDCDPLYWWLARGDQVVKSGNSGKQVPQSSAGLISMGPCVRTASSEHLQRSERGQPVDNPPGRSWTGTP